MNTVPHLLAAFVLACASFASVRAGDPIPVTSEKELQVVVHDRVVPRSRDSWTSPRMERERYLEFESAIEAVDTALAATAAPLTAAALAKQFTRARESDAAEILATLVALGRARPGPTPGTFVR